MFERILLSVDGSEHALRAAHTAADLARIVKPQELYVVVVYDPIPMYLGEPNMQIAISSRKGEAEKILETAVQEVGEVPCPIHPGILEGSPAEAIIEVAKTSECDLIVMGSRGLGQLAGLLLGSTSQKVVAHARCPVLIVR
ncbi:MAG: universal stress protein [Anaerolineales bacterium]|jgi:nucleotide-binding universal stress UspA family protein|nr:universal stress protein [Anaerolineales bacterium]